MSIPTTLFQSQVNALLWPSLLAQHGAEYDYHLAEGDIVSGVTGMLTEGREGEFVSPGRYAHCYIDSSDLPRPPRASDWIDIGEETYDVEKVEAMLSGIHHLIVKLTGQQWQTH